jgi:hypothetical protein
MMNSGIGIAAYASDVSIAFQKPAFAGAEILNIPPFQRVVGRTRPRGRIFSFPQGQQIASKSLSSKHYSFVFSLESFSRMNASISGALARMRSHCSL